MSFTGIIKEFFHDFKEINNHKATSQLDYEISEMEHTFQLLVFGVFTGMPAPPSHITTSLLIVMPDAPIKLLHRSASAHDALGELAELLGEP